MIYQNSRPVSRTAHNRAPKKKYEWRGFEVDADTMMEHMKDYNDTGTETRDDRYFIVPGRTDQISQLRDNETFVIKTLVETDGPLEVWETSVNSTIPMRRSLAAMIGAKIPKFSGPCTAAFTPDELTETLSKKSKFYHVKKDLTTFERDGVKARISKDHINDNNVVSISLQADSPEPILAELKRMGLSGKASQNYGGYLSTCPNT